VLTHTFHSKHCTPHFNSTQLLTARVNDTLQQKRSLYQSVIAKIRGKTLSHGSSIQGHVIETTT